MGQNWIRLKKKKKKEEEKACAFLRTLRSLLILYLLSYNTVRLIVIQ